MLWRPDLARISRPAPAAAGDSGGGADMLAALTASAQLGGLALTPPPVGSGAPAVAYAGAATAAAGGDEGGDEGELLRMAERLRQLVEQWLNLVRSKGRAVDM